MTVIFLQSRLDSSRLPGKAFLPLGEKVPQGEKFPLGGNLSPEGKTVTEHALTALSLVPADLRVLLTDAQGALGGLAALAHAAGWRAYIGPKEDVLARFAGAVKHFRAGTVIRATGDNPLVSPELAREALDLFSRRRGDYCGLDDIPVGTGVEIVRASCLLEADSRTADPYDREHVTPYLYRNPDKFTIIREPASRRAAGRVTLDTPEDYEKLRRIFRELYRGGPVPLESLYQWLAENEG